MGHEDPQLVPYSRMKTLPPGNGDRLQELTEPSGYDRL